MFTESTMPGMLHQVPKGSPGVNKIPVLNEDFVETYRFNSCNRLQRL